MVKKISILALAGLLAVPGAALAGGGDLESQIAELTRQLQELKAQVQANTKVTPSHSEDAEDEDVSSRFQLSGDFRARGDYYTRDRKLYIMSGNATNQTVTDSNNALLTNRLRINMRAKALENVEFKGRLAMYKVWGMQSAPDMPGFSYFGAFPLFDGNSTRVANDSTLKVDRAFVNWNNIGGYPIWFSIGRRPTTDGPPSNLHLGLDQRMATPTAYMDWPFDGVSVGVAYRNLFGQEDMPGRVRFCWGRGFESGLNRNDASSINDTDFAGVSWDIYKKGNRFVYAQSFVAMDVFNFPDWADDSANNSATSSYNDANRANIGNIIHTSAVYSDKVQDINYFVTLGWSRTDPNERGMLNEYNNLGQPAVLDTDSENGYSVYVGGRYDIPDSAFKLGLEYSHGSKYWIAMTPGHDDVYASKLATRGNTYEAYGIWDIPGGEAVSRYGKAFMRFGYIHYDYNYTGSMDWNVKPYDIDSAEAYKANYAGQDVVESADQVYLTFEAMF